MVPGCGPNYKDMTLGRKQLKVCGAHFTAHKAQLDRDPVF